VRADCASDVDDAELPLPSRERVGFGDAYGCLRVPSSGDALYEPPQHALPSCHATLVPRALDDADAEVYAPPSRARSADDGSLTPSSLDGGDDAWALS
jgi:hypothetical protein